MAKNMAGERLKQIADVINSIANVASPDQQKSNPSEVKPKKSLKADARTSVFNAETAPKQPTQKTMQKLEARATSAVPLKVEMASPKIDYLLVKQLETIQQAAAPGNPLEGVLVKPLDPVKEYKLISFLGKAVVQLKAETVTIETIAEQLKQALKAGEVEQKPALSVLTRLSQRLGTSFVPEISGASGATAAPFGKSWISEVKPITDKNGAIVPIKDADFKQGVAELEALSKGNDWRKINEKFVGLRGMRSDLGDTDRECLDRLFDTAARYIEIGAGEIHWQPSPDETYQLQTNTQARDKKFYNLISKVLDNPNEEAYKQFDLYDKANYDRFGKIIGTIRDHDGKLIGDKIVTHYQNLYDSILRLSDADYWAAHPAGDVEGLQKHMNFFKNGFALEAVSDPIAAHMMSCYEQAAELIRDLHDQYLPNELFSVHAARYEVYVDRLATDLFKQRVEAGAVRDYLRDSRTGLPVLDKASQGKKVALQEKVLTPEALESEDYRLRVKAARRMAKGMDIMTLRFTETLAFTRTPGVEVMSDGFNGDFTQKITVFSSKPYGGITRWHNPMAEWFRMYGFGDTLFVPFFNALAGSPLNAEGNALSWTLDQVVDVMNIADTGDRALLERKYGHGVIRLMDKVEEFSFSGRFGPLSMWGTIDSTSGWNDIERERLGGSMRLTMVQALAEGAIQKEYLEEMKHQFKGPEWQKNIEMQTAWLKAKIGDEHGMHHSEWKKKVEDLTSTYKTWVWTQYIMRNPQGAAAHTFVDYGQKPDGTKYRAKLKSKILNELFTQHDLKDFDSSMTDLIVERDIASGGTLTSKQYGLMERVAVLDGDLMAVQSYAMEFGQHPRDITNADFQTCIRGDKKIKLDDGKVVTVTEVRRREQALEYFKKVQREFFGKAVGDSATGWDVQKWRDELHHSFDSKGDLQFAHPEQIGDVFARATKESPGRLTRKLIDKKILVHIGTEDLQWRYLDLNNLGERHWGRRGNDFLTRAKTTQLEMEHFHLLTGHPDMGKLIESIQKIGANEKGHDPKEAAKLAWEWGNATHEIYRQRKLGGVPFVGKILPLMGIPMSTVQERLGSRDAVAWGANNTLHYKDEIGKTRVIPHERIIDGRDFGPYTMHSFSRQVGASVPLAIVETLFIGYAIAAAATAITAFTKSSEDVKH